MKPQKKKFWLVAILILMMSLVIISPSAADAPQQQATFQAPILVANTSFLNVRTGPSASYSVLVTIVGGTELPVLGVADDGVWYYVATDAGAGWVNVQFTLPRGDFSRVPLVDSPGLSLPGSIPGTEPDPGQGGGSVPGATPVPPSSSSPDVGFPPGATTVTGFSFEGGGLRSAPTDDTFVIRGLDNDPNTIYPLLDVVDNEGKKWYNVFVPDIGTAWTDRGMLRFLECSPGDLVAVLTRDVNLDRAAFGQPSIALEAGTEGLVTSRRGEAVTIQLQSGEQGVVPADALRGRTDDVISICENLPVVGSSPVQPGQPTSPDLGQGGGALPVNPVQPALLTNRVIVNTANLNVRSGPGASYTSLVVLPGGTELEVLGVTEDGAWYLIQGTFGQGWINSQFTIFRGNYSTIPILEDAYSNPVIITPGVSASITGTTNLGQGGGSLPATVNPAPTGVTTVTGFSFEGGALRSGPGEDSFILRGLPVDPNTIYPLLDTANRDGLTWYAVYVPDVGTGWLDRGQLRYLECGPGDIIAVADRDVTLDRAAFGQPPLFLEAGTEGRVVDRQGSAVTIQLITSEVGVVPADALRGRTEDVISICDYLPTPAAQPAQPATTNNSGTVPIVTNPASTANPIVPVLSSNRVIVNTGNLNIRSGPSASFSVVTSVPGGTELIVTGRAGDGVWYRVEGNFGVGWVNNQFTIFRGNYSTVPVLDVSVAG